MTKKLTYAALASAPEGSVWNRVYKFILEKYGKYQSLLDENFMDKLQTNDFMGRYWELLLCCLLNENCRLQIRKPLSKKDSACHDFNIFIDDKTIAVEATCIDLLPIENDAYIDGNNVRYGNGAQESRDIQLRVSSSLTGKKKNQYERILKAQNLDKMQPYILAVGLYGGFASTISFLGGFPTSYLGAVFPIGSPVVYFDRPNIAPEAQADKKNLNHLPNASYSEFNIKENKSQVSKSIFMNPDYSYISAIIFSGFSDQAMMTNAENGFNLTNDLILIHNPLAKNPLTHKSLPVSAEYVATISGDEGKVEIIDILKEAM